MTDRPWRRVAAAAGLLTPDGTPAPTVFAEMSALAAATGAINLGQGFPDTDGPAWLLAAAAEAVTSGAGGANQYPPGRGVPALREAIAQHQARYGFTLDPATEVLVTAGATEALTASVLALCGPGDEVVLLEPYYDAYAAAVALAGATAVPVPAEWPGYRLDGDRLAAAVTPRTRLIVLNNPNNPAGRVYDRAELDDVARVAREHDLVVLADEVYEHLTFDGRAHVPVATRPGLADRTITVSSAGKTFSVTGWKIGWLHARADLVDAVLAVKQWLTYVNGGPFQPAVASALQRADAEGWYQRAAADLQARRDLLVPGLRAAGFGVAEPEGTYFVVADAGPLGYPDGAALCRDLPRLAGVVAVPMQAFLHPGAPVSPLVRFACCKRPEVIERAAEALDGIRAR